jgi:hypothetical protein
MNKINERAVSKFIAESGEWRIEEKSARTPLEIGPQWC